MYSPISYNKAKIGAAPAPAPQPQAPQAAAQPAQSTLSGARAQTATPQATPPQNSMNKVMPASTAMRNPPVGSYAKGGGPMPASPDQIQQQVASSNFDPSQIDTIAKNVETTNSLKPMKPKPTGNSEDMESMLKQYDTKEGKQYLEDRNKLSTKEQPQKFASGGDVHSKVKNMPLKDVIKLLASHPEVGGQGALNGASPMQGPNLKAGGALMKSEAKAHGNGLLNMNKDVGTYAGGGDVVDSAGEVANNDTDGSTEGMDIPPQTADDFNKNNNTAPQADGSDGGILKMAGGGLEGGATEEDSITGYGPDGTPIVQNADGTQQYGDINQLLDRPESASTLGTGTTPVSGVSKNAANSVAQSVPTNAMAKGGEEAGVPPGSLSKEVADDVPAKLSEGEFVFSADVVRYYGLRLLTGMMEHARGELKEMNNEGNIRTPGDGKNPGQEGMLGEFMQDKTPDPDVYDEQEGNGEKEDNDDPTGILKECMGGGNYATGGGVSEDQSLAKGGTVEPFGSNNKVSAHPKGGGVLQDYAQGGTVKPTTSLSPKLDMVMNRIASPKIKLSTSGTPRGPNASAYGLKEKLPKMKKGGLLADVNQKKDTNPTQSYIT